MAHLHRMSPARRALPGLILAIIASCLLWGGGARAVAQGQPGGPSSAPAGIPLARQASNIAVVTIRGKIDSTTLASVKRRIELADRAGADAIVFELDTPGGELGSVLGICDAIKSSPVKNTVAWVHPMAYSGGAIIALACREMVTGDPGTMGDALIITGDPSNPFSRFPEHERQKLMTPLIGELVDSARRNGYDEMLVQGIASRGVQLWLVQNTETGQKLFVTRAEYVTMFGEEPSASNPSLPAAAPEAEKEGRPASGSGKNPWQWAADYLEGKKNAGHRPRPTGAVPPPSADDPNRFVPAAPKMDVSPGTVTMLQEIPTQRPVITEADRGKWRLLEYVSSGDGPFVFKTGTMTRYGLAKSTVNTDEELKAYLGGKRILRLEPTWSEGLVAFLTLMPVRGLLIAVFLIALFVELTHPGLVLPGAIAAGALIALLAPPMLINLASWWEIGAIGLGMVLLALEMFVIPGFGVAGVLGVVLLFGGLIGTFVPSGAIFDSSGAHRADLLYGMTTMVLALASVGVFMYFFARHFQSLPLLNRLILKDASVSDDGGDPLLAAMAPDRPGLKVGMTGVAVTNLRPAGQVEVGGELHDVVADLGYIPAGAAVRVTSVTPFRIGVEQASA